MSVIIQPHDKQSSTTCSEQVTSIKSLAGKGINDVKVLEPDADRPTGCVAYPVSTTATAYLYVKGRVDLDAEITKAQKKIDKAKQGIQKQEKLLTDSGYKEKVSAEVQEADQRKVAVAKAEIQSFEATIQQFEQLKLE